MKPVWLCCLALAAAVAGCERRAGSTGAVVEKTEVAAPASQPTDPTAAALRSAEQTARAGQQNTVQLSGGAGGNFSFAMPPGSDSGVNVAESGVSGRNQRAVTVTLNKKEPVLLTREAYDRVTNGMTYPQVAQAIGGDLAGSQMSDGFTGTFAVAQGLRRIELTFENGKVTGKTHAGLQWGPMTGPAR